MFTEKEEKQWLRHLIPLPQEISIRDAVRLHPREVGIRVRAQPGGPVQQGAAELEELFAAKTGAVPAGRGFEIVLGIAAAQGEVDTRRLQELPNNEQAYRIHPRGRNRLVLTAQIEKGV